MIVVIVKRIKLYSTPHNYHITYYLALDPTGQNEPYFVLPPPVVTCQSLAFTIGAFFRNPHLLVVVLDLVVEFLLPLVIEFGRVGGKRHRREAQLRGFSRRPARRGRNHGTFGAEEEAMAG